MDSPRIDSWLADLTLAEKCHLLAGVDSWHTLAIDRLGIPTVKLSDGPNGVRGEFTAGDRTAAVAVPVGIAQGASWDPELVGRVADLLGREARRRSAHVLLAPAVNLHRTPIGGRTFEYFSEDPELTAAMAVATVRAVQAHDVAVTVKHFVANDTEVDRNTVDVVVDERVLRELYLRPFEAAVRDAGAWGIMTAYNRLDGDFCAAHHGLLEDLLRDEWGFDGFVVSDWYGAHDAEASAVGGLSLEMPGPPRVYGEHLEAAVDEGRVDEHVVDALVRDLLVLVERTKATERPAHAPETSVDDPAERALCREAAAAGTVLVRNRDVAGTPALPLAPGGGAGSVAIIGPNAAASRTMGGGSSALHPLPHRSILDAATERIAGVVHEPGCLIDRHTPLPAPDRLVGPDGDPGWELSFVNGDDPGGEVVWTGRTDETTVRFFGSIPAGVGPGPVVLGVHGSFVAAADGPHEVGVIVAGRPEVTVGGETLIAAGQELPTGEAFFGFGSTEQLTTVDLGAGEAVEIAVTMAMPAPFGALRIGVREPVDADMAERAVQAARDADTAVVVVGTTDEWETEGSDRTTIALPGEQDDLVRRVAAVNDRTVVVVNAGSPVAMPWIDDVAAVLVPFFGGIEMADAVVDVLLGEVDPGGRLPTTFPVRLEDAPAWEHYAPVDGVQTYSEGFAIGYRGHDRTGVAPLFPFGHGLSYGTAEWGGATASTDAVDPTAGEVVTVTVPVTATGPRDATVVVQGYVAPVDPPVEREAKALRTWSKVVVGAGTTTDVTLSFGAEAFRRWDPDAADWTVDPGAYDLLVAASAADVRATLRVTVAPPVTVPSPS